VRCKIAGWKNVSCNQIPLDSLSPFLSVYRVQWLKAKSRYDRSLEEETLIKNEMAWTVRFFRQEAYQWEERMKMASHNGLDGHWCYAAQKADMWRQFAEHGTKAFGDVVEIQ
jgi:hypothetical protein